MRLLAENGSFCEKDVYFSVVAITTAFLGVSTAPIKSKTGNHNSQKSKDNY